MDTFSYDITVTPTGNLLVNQTPVAPADGGSYSSDGLLAWALDQVSQQWAVTDRSDADDLLTITIDDQRDGGYGRLKTRLQPGQSASIDTLRAGTGRNLEHWTPRAPGSAPVIARVAVPVPTVPTEPNPEPAAHDPSSPSTPRRPAAGAEPDPGTVAGSPSTSSGREGPASGREGPASGGEGPASGREGPASGPEGEASGPEGGDSSGEAEGSSGWRRYVPNLARLRGLARQRGSRSKMIMAAAAALVVVLALVIVLGSIGGTDQYVAVCVDQRTMARVNTDQPCVKQQSEYFRWWWVPDGSQVPAVGETVDPDQGSFEAPSLESPRLYGFPAAGGVHTSS